MPGETASAALLYRAGAGDRKTHRHGTTPRSAAGREARQRRAPSCCAAGHPALQPVPSRDFPARSLLPPGREAAGSSPPPSPTPHRSEGCHLPTSSPASHQHRTMVDVALLPRREERDRRRCPRSSAGRSARRCGHGTFRCPRRGSGPRLQRGAGSEAVTGFRREVKKKMIFKKKKRSNLSRLRCEARPPTADSFNGAWQPQVQVARRGGDSAARAPHAAAHHTRSSAAPSRRLRAGSPGPRAPPGRASAPRRASRPPEGGPLLARERSLSSARRSGAHPAQPRGRQTMWSPQDHPASFLFT